MRAYWDTDPADVSINAICKMAGISKPSLYRDFDNEDGFKRAVLDRYAERVLSNVFALLGAGEGLWQTLDTMIDFASDDPMMETGCLFYKMRGGKHRLGPKTLARVEEIDAAACAAYADFLRGCQDEWTLSVPVETAARYLSEQLGLAFLQRAAGEPKAQIRADLELSLSVFGPRPS